MEWKEILDKPDTRKIHESKTPSMGGIPIFLGGLFSLIIWLEVESGMGLRYLFSALIIFFLIGLRDDLIPMKPKFKLLSQLVPILMVVIFSSLKLESLYSLASFQFGLVGSVFVSAFTLIVISNSFNLIDGVNGLAGVIGGIILLTFGVWFYLVEEYAFSFISMAFFGGIIAFLFYNWTPSRIFMGDTGALLIGFLIGCLSVGFININYQLPLANVYKFNGSIATAIGILIIPLVDTLRVFILRLLRRKSPFEADNTHIHHKLVKLGLSHAQTSILLGTINIGFIIFIYIARQFNDLTLIILMFITASVLLLVLHLVKKIKPQAKKGSIQHIFSVVLKFFGT